MAKIDNLKGLKKGQFFLKAVEVAEDQVFADPEFSAHIEQYGKERENIARQAVANHQYNQVNQENGEYTSLLKLGAKKQQLWRKLAAEALAEDDLGFSPHQKVVLEQSLKMAEIIDQMYFKWREALIESELAKKMKDLGPTNAADHLTKRGVTNAYTIPILNQGGKITQQAYADYFDQETKLMEGVVDQLINKLQALEDQDPEVAPLVTHFTAFKNALIETEHDRLEQRWKEVDQTWMDVQGDLQPIHPMETYVDPARIRVDLEYRVVIPDESVVVLNDQAKITQHRLIRDLQTLYPDSQTLKQSVGAMASCKIMAGTTIVMSGWNLDFRSAGQNVPNREEVKVEKGVKIFLDTKSLEVRGALMKALTATIFGQDLVEKYYQDRDFLISAGIIVAGHEVSHNAFVTTQTDQKMGATLKSLVEETKATYGGLVVLPEQLKRRELTKQALKEVVTVLIGESLRELLFEDKLASRPYYITGVSSFNLLISSGVVKKGKKGWQASITDKTVDNFFKQLKKAFDLLVEAYEEYSPAKVNLFFEQYFVESEEIKKLIDLAKKAELEFSNLSPS